MEHKDKLHKIQNFTKETELHELLFDLLPKMGYADVTVTHERGSLPENGKDVVGSKFDSEENKKEWFAFVAKKGDVRGTSQGVQEIKAQMTDCFVYSWNSIVKGKNIQINKVKVVINGKYASGAQTKILEDTAFSNPNISFWSSNELVDYIDRYYPRYWLKGSKSYKHYIEIFQKKNKEDDYIKAIGLNNEKMKKMIDFAIQPKLIELSVNNEGDIKRKSFERQAVARLQECSLIVGESGSGKSTLFKQLANDIIYENSLRNEYELYPFIIKFSEFADSDFSVERVLENHLKTKDLTEINIDLKAIVDGKNFVLFIDALDEIGSNDLKEQALKSIQEFHSDHPQVKIYCASRPADSLIGSCQKLKFKYLEITNITQQQTEQFLNRYFNEEQVKCKRLLKSLRDSNILEKLPKTPLTLALVAAIFDEKEIEIPATISDLYKHFVDLLLNKSFKDSTLDLLKIGIHRNALSYLAEYLHIKTIRYISRKDLVTLFSEFAEERGQKYDINELINDLVQNIGLLIENDRNEIEFKHLSFQEYFTAYQFYNHNINGKNYFIENFNDIWWQNVAIFYAGMTKDSPELIEEILSKSVPKEFHEYLINLSGIGYLMQALYNTPISSRVEGVKRNLFNIQEATNFLLTTKEPEFDFFKAMFNTRYGVFKVMSYWYEFHHNSITLKEPLTKLFDELINLINNSETSSESRIGFEYAAYCIAATLAEIDDLDFKYLKALLDITGPKNFLVRALISSNFDERYKKLSKDERRRKQIKKMKKSLDLLDGDTINTKVNIRLLDGKKIFNKTTKSGKQKHQQLPGGKDSSNLTK